MMAKSVELTETLTWTSIASPWGETLLLVSDRGIRALLPGFAGDWNALQKRCPGARFEQTDTPLVPVAARVAEIFANPLTKVAMPLDPKGTPFQSLVWRTLRSIPSGTATTYSELARKIDQPRAQRAVAGACAANPIAVLIPCHRVVPANGGLGGYRWGADMKADLLAMESAQQADAAI